MKIEPGQGKSLTTKNALCRLLSAARSAGFLLSTAVSVSATEVEFLTLNARAPGRLSRSGIQILEVPVLLLMKALTGPTASGRRRNSRNRVFLLTASTPTRPRITLRIANSACKGVVVRLRPHPSEIGPSVHHTRGDFNSCSLQVCRREAACLRAP